MKIGVGSTNPVKVGAVRELILAYPMLAKAEVVSVSSQSWVPEQPMSLTVTIRGAINRAKSAHQGHDLGIGIESGLMEVPYTKSQKMNICACVVYNGTDHHIGLSSAFEHPPCVMAFIDGYGQLTVNEAFQKAGLTEDPKIGHANGAIGMLTNGRLTRQEYIKQALMMALIHLEHAELYKR